MRALSLVLLSVTADFLALCKDLKDAVADEVGLGVRWRGNTTARAILHALMNVTGKLELLDMAAVWHYGGTCGEFLNGQRATH